MPIIYPNTTDGYVDTGLTTDSWVNIRNILTASVANNAQSNWAYTMIAQNDSDTDYRIARSFLAFDTSVITAPLTAATLKVRGSSLGSAGVIVVKATAPDLTTGIATTDFSAIDGFSPGNTMVGNATAYSSEVTPWYVDTTSYGGTIGPNGGFNFITLNAAALADMVSLDIFKIALVNYDYDYLNITPPAGTVGHPDYDGICGMYFVNYPGEVYDPFIDYITGSAGYNHKLCAVASAGISIVNGVETANITKIIGKS